MSKGCTNNSWANWFAGTFLSTCASINIIKVFKEKKAARRETMDPHDPSMEHRTNFIDKDFEKHEEGEVI